jgi:type IV secretion system protein VirB11
MSNLIKKNLEILQPFLDNQHYKEIVIEKPYSINVETIEGKWLHFSHDKLSLEHLFGMTKLLATVSGKNFNEKDCIISVAIDQKHRLQAVYGKQTNNNISITIRLKRNSLLNLDDFNFSLELKEKLINLVKNRKTILISGGVGCGKTTLLNSLVKFINHSERIITIENVREIEINPDIYKHYCALTYLEDKTHNIADLLNSSLRMRPDRILIGELRNENTYLFLRACNTGHEGTISTIHANTPKGAIDALIHNIKTGTQNNHDETQIRQEFTRNINAILQLKREYQNDKMVVSGYLEEFF